MVARRKYLALPHLHAEYAAGGHNPDRAPCHKVQTRPVRDPARLRRMVEVACRSLTITPAPLWAELEANGDLADLGSLSRQGVKGSRDESGGHAVSNRLVFRRHKEAVPVGKSVR